VNVFFHPGQSILLYHTTQRKDENDPQHTKEGFVVQGLTCDVPNKKKDLGSTEQHSVKIEFLERISGFFFNFLCLCCVLLPSCVSTFEFFFFRGYLPFKSFKDVFYFLLRVFGRAALMRD